METLRNKLHYFTLSLEEAADFLGANKETIRRRAAAGEIPGAKVGKSWRFLQTDLVTYLRSLYSVGASQGVSHRRKNTWHSTSEIKSTGLISATTEKDYRKALGLATN